jgi:hypothetical protein
MGHHRAGILPWQPTLLPLALLQTPRLLHLLLLPQQLHLLHQHLLHLLLPQQLHLLHQHLLHLLLPQLLHQTPTLPYLPHLLPHLLHLLRCCRWHTCCQGPGATRAGLAKSAAAKLAALLVVVPCRWRLLCCFQLRQRL